MTQPAGMPGHSAPATEGAGKLQDDDWQLPESEEVVFFGRKTRFCICVFVINEGERIRAQLSRMKPHAPLADMIIADGGSTDGSLRREILEEAGVRALLVKRGPGRLSAQMRMALAWAMREGYEGAIVIDGNNKDDPSAIPQFIRALEEGVDHVQGSRYVRGGKGINTPLSRSLGVRLLHAPVLSIAARHRHTDTTNGFRAYSRRLLLDPRVSPFRDVFMGYELHYYLAIRASRLGYRLREVPVTRAYPREGKTPTKIKGVRGNAGILHTLMRAALNRFDP
jgi:dolichol-phosphate mannosyltransferase